MTLTNAIGCNAVLGLEDPVQAEPSTSSSGGGAGGQASSTGEGGATSAGGGGSTCPKGPTTLNGNVLANPSFEGGTDTWSVGVPSATLKLIDTSYCGCHGVEFSGSATSDYKTLTTSVHAKFLVGSTLQVDAYAYMPPNTVGTAPQLTVGFYDNATQKSYVSPAGFFNEDVGGGWFHATTHFKVPTVPTTDVVRVDVAAPTGKAFDYVLDCVTLHVLPPAG